MIISDLKFRSILIRKTFLPDIIMIQLLSLLFHFSLLVILYYLGKIVVYTLFVIQKIYFYIEELFGEFTSPRIRKMYKEVDFFYFQVLPTFFSNINKETNLTISSIETKYISLPIIFRILFAIIFTLFIMYCILLVTSYLYYYIILH
jgi:hypothetical protein